MSITYGLYEELLNSILSAELERTTENLKSFDQQIENADAPDILAQYLATEIKTLLRFFTGKEGLANQVQICNKTVEYINRVANQMLTGDQPQIGSIPEEPKLLLGIEKKNKLESESIKKLRPITPLNTNTLLTASGKDPRLHSELSKEIRTADHIDLLVSFIKLSGYKLIEESLREFTKTKKLRVITTTYMGATDAKAIKLLASLPNTEVKISYDRDRTRLHAKAYLFLRNTGFHSAYIGSSNLSHAAVTEGLEWNIKASSKESPQVITKFQATFETYWNDSEFLPYAPDTDHEKLEDSLKQETFSPLSDSTRDFYFDHKPFPYQREILDKLEVERTEFRKNRNLVVAATGTGKTVIAAFDYKRFRQNHNGNARLLFVAHRKEILEQSLSCFRQILGDHNFGELLVDRFFPKKYDHIFLSVQSYKKIKALNLDKNFFDFIIVDEVHHGCADSYQEILTYYEPQVLLGLTATPERMDGLDVTRYFDDRIASELRLFCALEKKLLSPFHYYCVSDEFSDLRDEKYWVNGKFSDTALSKLFTAGDARAKHIFNSLMKYVANPRDTIALGFCVDMDHAHFMALQFNKLGLPAKALTSKSLQEERCPFGKRGLTFRI